MNRILLSLGVVFISVGLARDSAAQTAPLTIKVDLSQPGKPISSDLFGIFFEDLNYAADGGLYAELVENRSFEYQPTERAGWNPLTAWELVTTDGGQGSLHVADAVVVHPNNPHYAVVETQSGGAGLANSGFDGIPVQAGELYDFSMFARQLYTGNRWGGPGQLAGSARFKVRLESTNHAALAEAELEVSGRDWKRLAATLTPTNSDAGARLVVLSLTRGAVALDEISLFPRQTFRNRPNGLRADLAQAIADLRPKFVRFPGGCLVHGYGLGNMYRWKDSIGPVEQRRGQPNLWGYHQSLGLGYYEFFQFCEDIGAKPLPVVPAAVCCQNADNQGGTGQRGLPLDQMPAYIQDVLDLIEWANGPTNSTWGAKRAAAGHPEPFHLQYLGVGNEEHITPVFKERFQMIYDAIKAKHPEITVIGTVGPAPDGDDFNNGWDIANELRVPMVDEHYYRPPEWFWDNLQRYDHYDRDKSKVYVGEYAAHDTRRRTTLRSALAEAAYLTSLERNGDVVALASYAPLLGKRGHTQWNPDLIYFSNTQVAPTINYYVQQMFGRNGGDSYLPTVVRQPEPAAAEQRGGVFLGTWNTQAEFDDVQVTAGSDRAVNETFDGPAQRWHSEAGNWAVSGGSFRQSGSEQPAIARLSGFTGGTNYTLSLRARKTGGSEGFLVGFRALDTANYYWWNLGGWGNTRDAVEKSVGGTRSVVGRDRAGGIESNRWYALRIETAGARIRCFLDGELRHEFTDTGFRQTDFAVSSVRDSKTGDIILKLVNGGADPKPLRVELAGAGPLSGSAETIVLTGSDPAAVNDFGSPRTVLPRTGKIAIGRTFEYAAPAHSLTVLRLK